MIAKGIGALLQGEPSIVAAAPGGIYPVLLPEGTTAAALTYQLVGGTSMPTFDSSGMQRLRVQFDCWGMTYSDADALRDALRRFLNGYSGTLSDGTFLQYVELIQTTDFFEQDGRQFRCMVEMYLYYNFND